MSHIVQLYDAHNVLLRDMTKGDHARMSLRQRVEAALTIPPGDLQIWVFEGADGNERRRAIFPDFKMQREPVAEDHMAHIRLFREVLVHTGAITACVPGYEGDDVLAALARFFAHRAWDVEIFSNDVDYTQLAHDPAITIRGRSEPPCHPRLIPLYKACVGKPSDNLKGIAGFAEKSWTDMTACHADMENAIAHGTQADLLALPFTPRVKTWLADPANFERVRAMYRISHFFDIDDVALNQGLRRGTPNRMAVEGILGKFML